MIDTFQHRFFILAPNFHGATLLSKLLNAHSEVVSLGDTYPSNNFDQICGCGIPVSKCSFWQTIQTKVHSERYLGEPNLLPSYPPIMARSIDRYLYNLLPSKVLARLISAGGQSTFAVDYERFLATVYELCDHQSPAVFVDGVKSVARVLALIACGQPVSGVLHLTRNPQDFVKSSMKRLGGSAGILGKSAVAWRLYHRRARKLKRLVPYMSISYESLAQETDATLENVFRFLGVRHSSFSEIQTNLSARWHFMGNARLFEFDGRIRPSHHETTRFERLVIRGLAGKR